MRFSTSFLSDLQSYRIGRRDAHSDHVHYKSLEEKERDASSFYMSLDGEWDFLYSPTVEERRADFYKSDFQCDGLKKITVPGHVELQGFGQIQYINTQYPWEGQEMLRPPMVPRDNPVSQYIRYFDLPKEMWGERIILRFDGVEQAMSLYLNGQFVGYTEDSFTVHEFEVTDYVKRKGNRLCVEVFKHCKSSWVEDQDFFRFSGIFRPVYLYSIPVCHVDDFTSHADFLRNGAGAFSMNIKLSYGGEFKGTLTYRLGNLVEKTVEISNEVGEIETEVFEFENIKPYHYRTPNLYDLEMTIKDSEGNVVEVIPYRIGFRHIEVENGMLMYNYHRLEICGVNRHEWSPEGGRCITLDDMKKDIEIIKGANINSVRTCHYPDRVEWYSLCDEAGIYLMAETNMESHGSWQKFRGIDPAWNVPGDNEAWRDMMLDRCQSNYHWFKNHASVIIWSLGNESYCGSVIEEMQKYYKSVDKTRPVHYEGVAQRPEMKKTVSDLESRMYAPPEAVREYLEKDGSKPYILCEYMHCMGNSLGGFKEYDDFFDEFLGYVGGYIWDFIDQALWKKDDLGRRYLAYGGDFGEKLSDYEFSCNGIVSADRKEKPCVQEVRAVYGNRIWGLFPGHQEV